VMSPVVIYTMHDAFFDEKCMVDALCQIRGELKENLPVNRLKVIVQVSIELMQNIINYSNIYCDLKEKKRKGYGSFSLIKKEIEQYKIITSNPISQIQKEILQKRVNELKKLNKNELQYLLKEKIRSKIDHHSKGAGVGLIRIFINSISTIEVNFKPMDNKRYLFSMEMIFK